MKASSAIFVLNPGLQPTGLRPAVVQTLARASEIDAVFKQGKRLSSDHFALHWRVNAPANTPESVTAGSPGASLVLASPTNNDQASVQIYVAFVVSKRHAKRAVRRNLIRRVWRAYLLDAQAQLPAVMQSVDPAAAGIQPLHLVVRLAKPFAKALFLSAASTALKQQISREAADLIARLQMRLPNPNSKPNPNQGQPGKQEPTR